ncbi:bZIP transcription factor [Ceratobasidium sp. AG-Ba]|nr:bZIP transcription factor [Ceratobasidium sp. AG-Ba]
MPTTLPVTGLRRRTAPLETAHAAQSALGMHSCLPSPPEDDMDVSSDDTITASGRKNMVGNDDPNGLQFTSGIPASSLHSPQSSPTHRRRTPSLSPSSSSSDDDTHTIIDAAHAHASSASSWGDLPILVTFISPAIALFTGGDYLRDLLVTCFLVWYLHQLIKVPWDIYLASLPSQTSSSRERQRSRTKLAHTHLRTTRILSLILAAFVPFIGAWLLTIGASLVSPESNPLSWFNLSLFVLAAGIRPWRHLTHLLLTRTDALHLATHRPSHLRAAFLQKISGPYKEQQREREQDRAKIHALESELAHLRSELNILSTRTRAMAKSLKDVDRRTTATQGRVELLERHGNINGTTDAGVGIWDGLGMIGAGVIGIVQGALCALFPFMASRANLNEKRGRKKGKKLPGRGSVNHLSPVPEEHPNGLDAANGIHLDGKGRDSSGFSAHAECSCDERGGFVDLADEGHEECAVWVCGWFDRALKRDVWLSFF